MKGTKNQKEIYNQNKFGEFKEHRLKKIIQHIPKKRKIKLCDMACGESQLFDKIKKYNKKIEYVGVEISDKQVKLSRNKGYEIKKHDLSKKLPFKDETFDIITATEIIEHIFDTDSFLSEIKRVLKKDGKIILTTPNCAGLRNRINLLMGKSPQFEYHSRPGVSGHIRYFDIHKIKELFKHNKLKIIRLTGREFYLPLIKYGSKLDFLNDFFSEIAPSLSPGFLVVAKKK